MSDGKALEHPFLVGGQIFLRGLMREDIEGPWFDWFHDQDNTRFMFNGARPNSRESMTQFYEHAATSPNDLVLAICMKENNRHVGNISLQRISWFYRRAELGIIVGDRSVQGRGVATEALKLILAHGFNRLNLHKVYLRVEEGNGSARRAFEKAGFTVEGILRDEIYHHRKWEASVYMGVLEEEFFARFPELAS